MQAFQWNGCDCIWLYRHVPYTPRALYFSHMQNLKPHDDESKDSNNVKDFDTFAEELDSHWYDQLDMIKLLTV